MMFFFQGGLSIITKSRKSSRTLWALTKETLAAASKKG